jgi:LuxR family transcriptional regulator, maltose regulon positive regulatory protein
VETESYELQALAHVRILIAQQKLAAALKILNELEAPAHLAGRCNTLIEILVLKAITAPASSTSLNALESALRLGIPEGYRRVFLDEGSRLQALLRKLQASSELVEPLLVIEQKKSKEVSVLTTREMDILRAMANGLSNKEIGQKLFISAGTVKAHSAAIYRKLEVLNRTEAIARAKDLGLI